ncbi:hypothetical protein AAFF_G00367910 [Aldrovandia affinis]|uniref:Ubiquitin-like protease family profile domain-containing protein n=1 Tax=Aldrovandia affinis TaxID=143900 RepID=A0AAD7R4N3_9TELE|nr:hypothetical protein AAFF_G00367910 [Aldrovandia affinis]
MPPDQRGATAGLCFYHSRFGTKAKQCLIPCNFNPAGNGKAGARRAEERHSRSEMDIMSGEHGPQLATADGSPIHSYGVRSVELCFGALPDNIYSKDAVILPVCIPGHWILCSLASQIEEAPWTIATNRDLHGVPEQSGGLDCGVFVVMYAFYLVQKSGFDFTMVNIN